MVFALMRCQGYQAGRSYIGPDYRTCCGSRSRSGFYLSGSGIWAGRGWPRMSRFTYCSWSQAYRIHIRSGDSSRVMG